MREPPAPPHVPDYELLREIGRGSYGVVWLARSVTGLYRAVKIVWRASFEEPQPYEREFRGIREFAAISLHTPRQLALLHVGRNDAAGFFYYVMELADDADTGRDIDPARYRPNTLKEVSQRKGRRPATEAVKLGVELAEGLAELHRHGLVHRDIKPSNIIFAGGAPKLADIGLIASARTTDLTLSRVGNAGYMPPDFPGTASADAYGLGKVLYELVTGRTRDDFPALPPDLGRFPDRKELLELNEILVRACAPIPERRYENASVLLDELLLLQAGRSVRRLRATERHLSRALRAAALLAIVAAVAGAGAWIAQQRANRETALRAQAEADRDLDARKNVYSATLTRAQRALETTELGLARRHLRSLQPAAGEPDLRGFEWHALWTEAQGDSATVAHAGNHIIKRILLSPDQKTIAGQVGDSRTLLWDAKTLREVGSVSGTRLLGGFSADGQWIIGTNQAQGLQRWRVATGEPDERSSEGFNFPVEPVGPDRVWGLVREPGGIAIGLRLWNLAASREEASLPLALDSHGWFFVPFPAVRDDGGACVVSIRKQHEWGAAWRWQVYDLNTRRLVHELTPNLRTTALALSPDGHSLAAGLADGGTINVFDLHTGQLRWQQPAGMSIIEALAFSPDNRRLLAGGSTSAIRMFEAQTGENLGDFRGHDVGIRTLCWTPGSETFFSADSGGDLRRWSLSAPRLSLTKIRKGYRVETWADMVAARSVCVSDDGSLFAASVNDATLRISDLLPDSPERDIEAAFPLSLDASAKTALTLTTSGELRSYSLAPEVNLRERVALLPFGSFVNCAALSANKEVLVAGSPTGQVWLWDARTRAPLAEVSAGQSVLWVAISRSGNIIVANGRDNDVRVWSSTGGKLLAELKNGSARRMAFGAAVSPDDRSVALCFETGEVEIRPIADLDDVRRLRTDSAGLYGIGFSPDGSRLYCGGTKGWVHVYATGDWRLIVTLGSPATGQHRDDTVTGLTVSASGNTLATFRADGSVRIWNTDPAGAHPLALIR